MPVQPITPLPGYIYGTYSFINVTCSLMGPNANYPLGAGAGSAEEGITIEPTGDQATMTIGADGSGMYSLHADRSGRFLIRLLKISPTNALLMATFEADRSSSAFFGQNTIVVNDTARGDNISGRGVAIMRAPTIVYGREGAMQEWTLGAIVIDRLLGTGVINVTPP